MMNMGAAHVMVIVFCMVVPTALMIWAIVDLLKRDFPNSTNKLIWALVIIFIPFVGAIVYLVAGRSGK